MKSLLALLLRLVNTLWPPAKARGRGSLDAYIQVEVEKAAQLLGELDKHFPLKGKTVLDLGCGPGGVAYFLSRIGAHAIGIDVASIFLHHAVSYGHKQKNGPSFVQGDIHALPIRSNSVDVVLAIDTIEHVKNPSQVIKECSRVLRDGGLLFVAFPPFYGRRAHHLYDYINIPWAHLLFPSEVLAHYWKARFKRDFRSGRVVLFPFTPEEIEEKVKFEQIFSLNKLTVAIFEKILQDSPIKVIFKEEYSFLPSWLRLHVLREIYVDYVVYLGIKISKPSHVIPGNR